MADEAAIEIRAVTKAFGAGDATVTAVREASLTIGRNEFFTLLGPSGCGKTTLLRMIAGFDYPTAGAILLDGEPIADLPPYRRPVNTVFQSYALFPHMTVAENVGFGLEMLGRPKADIRSRVEEMLALVRMTELAGRKTSQISGGQQQRVALARALAPAPKVLLLDEPLSALDYKLRKDMQIELKRLQTETGITFVFVTHDQEEALTMSDRIAVMSRGEVLQVGSPRDIYERPAVRFVANFIGETNFLQGSLVESAGDTARVRLDAGVDVLARGGAGHAADARVTVVIRPEHARLVPGGSGADLSGTLETAVYFGTDTHVHIRLRDGSVFMVRQQNALGSESLVAGETVGIRIDPHAAQVMAD